MSTFSIWFRKFHLLLHIVVFQKDLAFIIQVLRLLQMVLKYSRQEMWAKAFRSSLTLPLSKQACHSGQVICCLKVESRFYFKRTLRHVRHHKHQERKSQIPQLIPHLFGVWTFLGGRQNGTTWWLLLCQAVCMVYITDLKHNLNKTKFPCCTGNFL